MLKTKGNQKVEIKNIKKQEIAFSCLKFYLYYFKMF